MAVTVAEVPSMVLDDDYRVVEVNEAAAPLFAQHVGQVVFDCFPGSRNLFRPHYEEARRTGNPVKFAQFYNGHVIDVTATPAGARLTVSWEPLTILDTWTLDGLRLSLRTALAKLDEVDGTLERNRLRSTLKLLVGSA